MHKVSLALESIKNAICNKKSIVDSKVDIIDCKEYVHACTLGHVQSRQYIVISNKENSNMEFRTHAILFSRWSSEFDHIFN